MSDGRERDGHVPSFSESPEKDFELRSARLMASILGKELSREFEPPCTHDDAKNSHYNLTSERQARSVIVRVMNQCLLKWCLTSVHPCSGFSITALN